MIVDTSALFSILFNEPDFPTYLELLASGKGDLTMSVATQVEAYVVAQRSGLAGIEEALGDLIVEYGIRVVPVTSDIGQLAITAHRTYGKGSKHPARLNFGDCFSYALAKATGEPLLFKGNDFGATDITSAL